MKIFEEDGRVNFVDENNVFVGYNMGENCCERFGWFISEETHVEIPEKEPKTPDVSDYVFDTSFFVLSPPKDEYEEGGIACFKLGAKDKPILFLHLYNSHNGYYSHGFTFKINDKVIKEDSL